MLFEVEAIGTVFSLGEVLAAAFPVSFSSLFDGFKLSELTLEVGLVEETSGISADDFGKGASSSESTLFEGPEFPITLLEFCKKLVTENSLNST